MPTTPIQNRTVATLATMLAVAAVSPAGPAHAIDSAQIGSPVSSTANLVPFEAGRYLVVLSVSQRAHSGDEALVCVHARRSTVVRNILSVREEYGCNPLQGYGFDAVHGRAVAAGTLETYVGIERYRLRRGEWVRIQTSWRHSRTRLDLTWEATSDPEPGAQVKPGLPWICYAFPPICPNVTAGAWVSWRAVVEGTMRFRGIELDVRMPGRQPGRLDAYL